MAILDHVFVDEGQWRGLYHQVADVIEDNAVWWPPTDEPMQPLLEEETHVADGIPGIYIISYLKRAQEFGPFGRFVYVGISEDVGGRLRGYARGSNPLEAVVHNVLFRHWLKLEEALRGLKPWDPIPPDALEAMQEASAYLNGTRPEDREFREKLMRNASLGFRVASMSMESAVEVERLVIRLCAKIGIPLWNEMLYGTVIIWPEPNPHLSDAHIMWALDVSFGHEGT